MKISGRPLRQIWNTVQVDAKFMRNVNGWLTIFWIAMIPISLAMGWLNSVVYVSALSLWALVSGHWSAWQAARTEVNQQKQEKEDTEGKIVQRLIKETDLHKNPNLSKQVTKAAKKNRK